MHHPYVVFFLLLLILPACGQPVVSWSGETMRVGGATVTPQGGAWQVGLVMEDDNGNGSLPSSYRRWWHCEIGNLNVVTGETLHVQVSNAGYTDIILPVWSLKSGGAWGPYVRLPLSAVPTYSSGTHSFTAVVPAGVSDIRLAKYFPYTVADKDQYVASITGHPLVPAVSQLGLSTLGRPITRVAITDTSAPAAGKRTVWIHSGIHPAETTSYPVVEGLIDFLISGDPRADVLVRNLIFEIVPMANPDGVALGNYRTNANSVNLENEWEDPYNSTQPEIVAMRNRIETLMGTSTSPGSNPIEVLLNLHASHGLSYPFHYRHSANATFDLVNSRTGVVPSVHALETAWIDAVEQRSAFVDLGTTGSSSCGAPARRFVECMMHDRWSIDPAWTGSPNLRAQVMAITFEGTYRKGPDAVSWNVPDDYRQVGQEMALALGDYFGLLPAESMATIGTPCASALPLSASLNTVGTTTTLTMTLGGVPTGASAWLVLGPANIFWPLPCPLVVAPDILLPMPVAPWGDGLFSVNLVPTLDFAVPIQGAAVDLTGPVPTVPVSDGYILSVIW